MPLDEHEWKLMEKACAEVPPPPVPPSPTDYPDYVENLMLTPLDLRLQNVIVNNAVLFYRSNRKNEIRTLDDLEATLARFPDDPGGNREAALYLWGYAYADRLASLRALVKWAREMGLTNQEELKSWALGSDYRRDFSGRARGLGFAAYCWLIMRLGVDTVKPDSRLHAFVVKVLGRDLGDEELVGVITEAARRVGRRARELDSAIWEYVRGGPGSI